MKSREMGVVLAICLFAATSSAAFADGYIGFGLGAAKADVATATTPYKSDTASLTQLIAGYSLNRHWSLEVGYTDFSETSVTHDLGTTTDSTYVYRSSQRTQAKRSAATLSVAAKLPLMTGDLNVDLVGRFGAARWRSIATTTNKTTVYLNAAPWDEVATTSTGISNPHETGIDPMLALGLALKADFVSIRVEYSRYAFGRDTVGGISTTVLVNF